MIALYHGSGIIGAAIRWQTWGQYSHAAWILPDGSVIEAWQSGGVRHNPTPFSLHGEGTLIDVYTVKGLTAAHADRIEGFLRHQVGRGYDFLGILRFLSRVNRNNYERWFCSELVAEACQEAGRPLLHTDAWRVCPSALAWSTELTPAFEGVGFDWWAKTFRKNCDAQALEELLP